MKPKKIRINAMDLDDLDVPINKTDMRYLREQQKS